MRKTLWREYVVPFVLVVGLLGIATLAFDYLLHRLGLVWIGRYLGIPGTLLIIVALTYSLRKRKFIDKGNPRTLLRLHEIGAWLGSLMILVHAGIHFNAWLPWLAIIVMGINVISGLVGRLLLDRSRRHLMQQRQYLQQDGLSAEDIDHEMFWDTVMVKAMQRWRVVHIPIFILFAVLSLGHIISIFIFWGWS